MVMPQNITEFIKSIEKMILFCALKL